MSSRLCILCDGAGFSVWLSLSFPISKMGITIAPTWLGCLRAKEVGEELSRSLSRCHCCGWSWGTGVPGKPGRGKLGSVGDDVSRLDP